MNNLHQGEDINDYNESSLQQLAWAIEASSGEFSLILARCNYAHLREQMVQRLRKICSVEIQEIVLDESVRTLYTALKNELGDEQPPALTILGLESVVAIEQLLTATNHVREEFRKNLPFPLVLWVTDDILQKLMRLAPDFESWATTIEFANTDCDLIDLIQKTADNVFAKVLEIGAGLFLDNAALNLGIGSPRRAELESAWQELINRGIKLEPELEASLEFVLGRDASTDLETSRQHYDRSLAFWQQTQNLERQGCLLYCLGLWWRRYAEEHRAEYELACLRAKNYFQQCVGVFEQTKQKQLVAKFINALGSILQLLQHWDELEVVAKKALALHQVYSEPSRLARAYGFLAEVALAKSAWTEAKQLAEEALFVLESGYSIARFQASAQESANLDWVRSYHQGWYLLALGRSLFSLDQTKEAIKTLEIAVTETKPHYDPSLYIRILEKLRQCYFQEGQYLTAFKIKQQQRSIEQQYSLRAFIGAGRLQPKQQVTNPGLPPVERQREVAQEIAASGRQQDVDRLIQRIRRHDYKLTVIHGQSGVGKSSIVQAGLIPALQQKAIAARQVLPICQHVYTDWIRELGQRLSEAIAETQNSPSHTVILDSTEAILNQLHTNGDRNLLTVLIFDQFEEFFFVCKEPNQRREFYDFLRDCLDIPYLKVILSLREDYLHYLLEFSRLTNLEVINNNILDKNILYYLGNFSAKDARKIIQDLTLQTQLYLEPLLIDKLVEDLAKELGEVRPIELQVVGAQLQTEKISTLARYREYGSKRRLVELFLEEVVKDCGLENERIAQLVLYSLTDENNTRPLKTHAELEASLKVLGLNVESQELDLVLEILVGSRLVFLVPEVPNNRYQLVHDYLVGFIRYQQEAGLVSALRREKEHRKQTEAELNRVLKRQLKAAVTGLSLMAVLTTFAVAFWRQAEFERQQAEIKEIQGLTSASKALFYSDKQLEALISSVKASKQLQKTNAPSDVKNETVDWLRQAYYEVRESNRIEGHIGWVLDANFSPNGEIIATAGRDQTVKLWSRDGKLLKTLFGHRAMVSKVIFSPDGQTIASASYDGTAKLWSRNGILIRTLNHSDRVYDLSFSPDGQTIASASRDKTVKLWNRNGKLLKIINHNDRVYSVSFSPDGQTIASAGKDKAVKLWNRNGKLLKILVGHQELVWGVSFSPDGQTLASASADKTVKLWSRDGKLQKTLEGHRGEVYSVSFSPNGQIFACAGKDNSIILWSRDGALLKTIKGHTNVVNNANFSPDGNAIISAGDDATARIWSFNKEDALVKVITGHSSSVWGVSFSPDGQTIASASDDTTIKLWNRNGTLLTTFKGHKAKVNKVSFSPDGQIIASVSDDKTVKLWRWDGILIKTLNGHSDKVYNVTFSPDGKIIASVSADKTIKLWRQDGKLLKTLKGHSEPIWDVSFSPDGQTIASASDDGTVKLWRRDGTPLKTLIGHSNEVNGVLFSPDGQIIASASSDTTVKLWTKDGSLLNTLEGHRDMVNDLSFSPDGQLIASAGRDDTVKIWNREGRLLMTFETYGSGVLSVSFSPDGKMLASVGHDGTVKLWRLNISELNSELDDLLVRGCDRLRSYLKNNPNVRESDRHLCDSIKTKKLNYYPE